MRKVITGSLDGNAWQFEEGACVAIKACARHMAARRSGPQ